MLHTTMPAQLVREALHLACRAPSFHNSQPWRWVLDSGRLELHLDPQQLVASDSSGRQALLSCGAVLDHLQAASAATGWATSVERYPNPNDHKHIATIGFIPMEFVTEGHRRRAEAIRRRRTDRLPLAEPADWPAFEPMLHRAVGDAALIDVLDRDDRPDLQQAAARYEAARLYDSTYHADLHWWTSSYAPKAGIPQTSLTTETEEARVGIGRRFPAVHHFALRPDVSQDESRVVVLSTYDDSRLDVLRCGEALSAALLTATMDNLATCTLTHLTEVTASREVVQRLTGREFPQVLVRMGSAPVDEETPPPTPRRPLSEVLVVHT